MKKKQKLPKAYTHALSIFMIILITLNATAIISYFTTPELTQRFYFSINIANLTLSIIILILHILVFKQKSIIQGLTLSKIPNRNAVITNSFKKSLEGNQFSIAYQPIIDLTSGNIVELEPLLRWHHPTLGSISPNEFIPLAEKSGFILPLGNWMIKEACHQLSCWKNEGYNIKLSINISALQLHFSIIKDFKKILQKNKIDPSDITLEITESVLLDNTDKAKHLLKELKFLGVKLAMDDFGVAYSSFSYLKQFSFDKIKIDKHFIENLGQDNDHEILLASIIEMAKKLDLVTVAEGVETRAQIYILQKYHCDQIQGFFFSPPLKASELSILLNSQPNLWKLISPTPPSPP